MRSVSDEPDSELQDRIERVLGWRPTAWRRVYGGYTPAARYRVARGEQLAFVKIATTQITAAMLRGELAAYAAVTGPFLPHYFGGEDHETQPLLAIEDLGAARWPPPWTDGAVADALGAIEAMHRVRPALPSVLTRHGDDVLGWRTIVEQPDAFLGLGLVSRDWLAAALPALVAAETACRLEGETLAHYDLRSDNICFSGRGPVFVDWAAACCGDADVDLGGWLPSLAFEGGPPPEAILPQAPEVAAWTSGYFAARAGLPVIPDAPFVRRVQREQLSTALPWVQRALKLSPLDG